MGQTKTTALSFRNIIKKAKEGSYKLPAFQRKWKWTSNQVISLYNSLRLNYPIGSLLFLTSDAGAKLDPRAFYGAGPKANSNAIQESLVLDGQQRITAGLSIYYGLEDDGNRGFYIDCKRIEELINDRKINIDDEISVTNFALDIEVDDGYIVAKKTSQDKKILFEKNKLLWTPYLTEEHQDSLDELLDNLQDKRQKDIIRKVIRKYFKPNFGIQVPVIELGNEFDFSAISKIFSTINSSGKPLTPFELVVAILHPNGIKLEDDIEELKVKHQYYSNMDKNGEILLQIIAKKAGRPHKKSTLPKSIDHVIYEKYKNESAELLDKLGKFLTNSLGVGLDTTGKLVPYDAIFTPMALALEFSEKIESETKKADAYSKLRTWFVSSAIGQRYQEGVHGKQDTDLRDIQAWIESGETPSWISTTFVTAAIKSASPNGAIGKLFHCMLNAKSPKDPLKSTAIGFSQDKNTQIHHIFPTRWVEKGISDYSTNKIEPNIALNTMFLDQKTNADWLNFDPKSQINLAMQGNPHQYIDAFSNQFLDNKTIELLRSPVKNAQTFRDFIDARYELFKTELAKYGIQESSGNDQEDLIEMEVPIES